MGTDSVLAMGLIRLLPGLILFIAAFIKIFKGNPGGNLNLISAVCFGFFAGTKLLADGLQDSLGFHLHPFILNGLQVYGGLYIILNMPALVDEKAYRWIVSLTGGVALVFQGLAGIIGLMWISWTGAFFMLVYAALNIYAGLSVMVRMP